MDDDRPRGVDCWARLRFSVIGGLLASPPERGELGAALEGLAARSYRHPLRPDERLSFGASTIERWYYQALGAADPIAALARKVRVDAGQAWAAGPDLLAALGQQYREHRSWSYQLHFDNLVELVKQRSALGPMPSYPTIRRRMKERGWVPRRRLPRHPTPGQVLAAERLESREVRGYEASHVHGLWHADFHIGSRAVVLPDGSWQAPAVYATLDDCCRLCLHAQWYLTENAENHAHGLSQAILKRGLPRAYLSDRGGAFTAGEILNGLERLGVAAETTLPYSAYQNGKQEYFWTQVEGRLLAMLENVEPLTLPFLNRATQAWVELEYNRKVHSELGQSPLDRLLAAPSVGRPSPGGEALRLAFCQQESRTQRHSDGTVSIGGVRFELPSRFRHVERVQVRFRSWDLTLAYLVDPRTGVTLARLLPLDKARNADGRRRAFASPTTETPADTKPVPSDADPLPPLMRRLLADYARSGLPPAYLPKDEQTQEPQDE